MAAGSAKSRAVGDQLEALARAEFTDLQPSEVALIRAATTTDRAECGPTKDEQDVFNNPAFAEDGNPGKGVAPWSPDREVRAEVIRWLCINRDAKAHVDPRGVQLFGARVTGELDLRHAEVPFPLSLVQCRLLDKVFLNGCTIPRLDFHGSWTGPIDADGVHVKQSAYLRGVHAKGIVSLNLAQIGDSLTCEGGTFIGEKGAAVWADGIKVGGDLFLRADSDTSAAFSAKGGVRLVGAEIHGDLDCSGGQFLNAPNEAITLQRATIHGEIFFGDGFKVEGIVDLSNTSTTAMADDQVCWPKQGDFRLDGFSYTSLDPNDAKTRLCWLALDSSDATQPYRQLAKVLQDSGDAKNANRVLIAMEKKLSSKDRLRWLKAMVGYGYRPGNAIWMLAALWILGSLLCWQSYETGMIVPTDKQAYVEFQYLRDSPAYYQQFEPFVFSLENTFPLVKLGQVDKWQAASQSAVRWFIWTQILLGWLLATLFVAAVSGIVRHD
ncbi:MAG TPA: hypothetical protein VK752_14850 [Bryobacteraceae bacterium]|jgi:hypothetical protein|nr:hypothetical protein [Bryobacteraceae bacterium]